MGWSVYGTKEFYEWFESLPRDGKLEMGTKVNLLPEFGPHLKRPHADTLHESKLANLKELRGRTFSGVYRATFIFDESRQGILLIGGNKKGKNQKKFYKDLIKTSEDLFEKYENYKWKEDDKWKNK
ncbi:MAG: type II toxin-antitoxin system RelE/ParE family toxin [Spirochaetaceae bacterium]|jgi:hypothetical protein|nr:type II toxin-antitoxin system RelE/ParE family toxin [Spirochaetaceae bacterium]